MRLRFRGLDRPPFHLAIAPLLLALIVGAIGCGSNNNNNTGATTTPPATAAPSVAPSSSPSAATGELSGTWSGQYSGTFNGTFTLNWTETSSKLSGTIKLSTAGTLSINGTVTGGAINFGTVGSTAITYSGSVSGNTMSGTYKVAGGGSGSWTATRAS